MRIILFALLAALTSSAGAQDADRAPLGPELQGAWALEAPVVMDPPGVEIVAMTLTIEGNRVRQEDAVRANGELMERAFTVECFDVDGVIGCLPSEDGTTGYGGLGRYAVEGGRLLLSMPGGGDPIAFRRAD